MCTCHPVGIFFETKISLENKKDSYRMTPYCGVKFISGVSRDETQEKIFVCDCREFNFDAGDWRANQLAANQHGASEEAEIHLDVVDLRRLDAVAVRRRSGHY
jgi:hypothetical protein